MRISMPIAMLLLVMPLASDLFAEQEPTLFTACREFSKLPPEQWIKTPVVGMWYRNCLACAHAQRKGAVDRVNHEKEQLDRGHALLDDLEATQLNAQGREREELLSRIAATKRKLAINYDNIIRATRRLQEAEECIVDLQQRFNSFPRTR